MNKYILIALVLVFAGIAPVHAESLTLTAYYPSPSGDYLNMRVSGWLGVGVAAPTYKLQVNGQPAANGYTAWTNYSDARLKENVTDMIPSGRKVLDKIGKLRPVMFNYNKLTGYDEKTRARRISGFIAQELRTVFPEMVGKTVINGKPYFDTDLSNLQLYLVAAIQELHSVTKELSSENIALRQEIKTLRTDFDQYKKRHK